MNDLTKRFIETYKALGLTGYKMGKECNVITKQKISNIETGRTNVSTDMLSEFLDIYGKKVNPNYILKGELPILYTSEKKVENDAMPLTFDKVVPISDETRQNTEQDAAEEAAEDSLSAYETFLLPMSVHGGSLTGIPADGTMLQNCEKIVSPIKGVDFAITVYGESMSPEYPSGSRVLIKKINPDVFIDWGKVYVLDTSNGVIIKQVTDSGKEGVITCHSINPDPKYSDFDVSLSEVYGMYRVLMCMSAK